MLHKEAANNIQGLIGSSFLVGVNNDTFLLPAINDGIAFINTVDTNGAVPPGIYSPTFSIGMYFLTKVFSLFLILIFLGI
ncbi:hypothetical protein FACS189459_3410 [Bacilli bacterium]|nr:hypothetical protein FACS189459_3410 [Bacilli bacterium]